jgi:hypothetical protein
LDRRGGFGRGGTIDSGDNVFLILVNLLIGIRHIVIVVILLLLLLHRILTLLIILRITQIGIYEMI